MIAALALQIAGARFEKASPLVGAPAIMVDTYHNGVGVAIQTARAERLQARIMWVDFTANIERINSTERCEETVRKIKAAGFNTIVFDVKPLSGQVAYPSRLAPKLREWRGKVLPVDFDPLAAMSRIAKREGLAFFTSLNAFSEGHNLLGVGPGYAWKSRQSVVYETENALRVGAESFRVAPAMNQAEPDAVGVFAGSTKSDVVAALGADFRVTTQPNAPYRLVASGETAKRLARVAHPGALATFETRPVFVPTGERPKQQYPLMMNPNDPEVRAYETAIAEEIVRIYPVDGIIYDDRLRYQGLNADFSESTWTLFERWLGQKAQRPTDAFTYTVEPTKEGFRRGIRPGRFYDAWLQFRALRMTDFVDHIRNTIRGVRPGAQLGVYAGSWYGEYQSLGNNWASPDAESAFWFATKAYRQTGFAAKLDFLVTGCYYPVATTYDAMTRGLPIGSTVEAAGILSNRMVRDQTWCYAGISLGDFKGNPSGLMNALQAACASTQGVMVFDLSHDVEPMWPVFRQAFVETRVAPHQRPKTLEAVRARRAALDAAGVRELPIPFASGSAGTGQ